MKLSFIVPGVPQAKRRHRTVPMSQCLQCQKTVQGQYRECPHCSGTLRFVKNLSYSDSESVKYENLVAYCAKEAMTKAGMESMFSSIVNIELRFTFPIPSSRLCNKPHAELFSLVAKDEKKHCKKLHPGDKHGQRPDYDNLAKSMDGLIGILFADDSIISDAVIRKRWGSIGQAEIQVEEI